MTESVVTLTTGQPVYATGYTLGQMVERVRQALPSRVNSFGSPTLGPQGLTAAEFISRVRRGLRDDAVADSDRFISDDEILQWVNEGLLDVSDRTHAVRNTAVGTTDGTPYLPLPVDYLGMNEVYIGGVPWNKADDNEEWNDWAYSNSEPTQGLWRIVENTVQVFPLPASGTPWTVYYTAQPITFGGPDGTDLSNVPVSLQSKVIQYARAFAHWRLRDYYDGDRYMSLYESGLGPGLAVRPTDGEASRPRDVQDYEIVAWLNEAFLQLAWREEFVLREYTSAPVEGVITLPVDYLKTRFLRLVSVAGADETHRVEFVNDDVFDTWTYDSANSVPAHYIARISGLVIEIHPVPSGDAVLRYIAAPTVLTDLSQRSEVPLPLQQKAIDYARYQALLSAPVSQTDLPRADRYMASFEAGLKKATVNERNIAGPITLVMQPGYWDLDPETAHL
jgi:hypothetical protein